jgi:hypothetical protein
VHTLHTHTVVVVVVPKRAVHHRVIVLLCVSAHTHVMIAWVRGSQRHTRRHQHSRTSRVCAAFTALERGRSGSIYRLVCVVCASCWGYGPRWCDHIFDCRGGIQASTHTCSVCVHSATGWCVSTNWCLSACLYLCVRSLVEWLWLLLLSR